MTKHQDLFDLTGKVAVVTGAAGILGRHFVEALAAYGATVIALDLDKAELQQFADQVTARSGKHVLGLSCDITDRAAVKEVAEEVERTFGPIDILHNNAATKGADLEAFFAPVEEYSEATWREIMAVNIDAMFFVAQEIGGHMARRGSGSIIQTASIYGILGPDARIYEGSKYLGRQINTPPVYAASKGAVIGLTRYLATLWGASNVRVNALVPGGVSSGQNEAFEQRYASRVPLGRMARADEMVGALIYLASDASSYVTGQTIVVDGGLSAW